MKVDFIIGIKYSSTIDKSFNSISEIAEWIKENYCLPNYLSIRDSDGYCLCTIDLHQILYNCTDTMFQIIMKGLIIAIEEDPENFKGIEIQF